MLLTQFCFPDSQSFVEELQRLIIISFIGIYRAYIVVRKCYIDAIIIRFRNMQCSVAVFQCQIVVACKVVQEKACFDLDLEVCVEHIGGFCVVIGCGIEVEIVCIAFCHYRKSNEEGSFCRIYFRLCCFHEVDLSVDFVGVGSDGIVIAFIEELLHFEFFLRIVGKVGCKYFQDVSGNVVEHFVQCGYRILVLLKFGAVLLLPFPKFLYLLFESGGSFLDSVFVALL